MIVRDVNSPCDCIHRVIIPADTDLRNSGIGGRGRGRDRSKLRGESQFIVPIAVCLAQHLRQEQVKESYFGKMYNQKPDGLTSIAARLFSEKLEMETTN